jgi:hypothetical protein
MVPPDATPQPNLLTVRSRLAKRSISGGHPSVLLISLRATGCGGDRLADALVGHRIVLDVSEHGEAVNFGFYLRGRSSAWARDFELKKVGGGRARDRWAEAGALQARQSGFLEGFGARSLEHPYRTDLQLLGHCIGKQEEDQAVSWDDRFPTQGPVSRHLPRDEM